MFSVSRSSKHWIYPKLKRDSKNVHDVPDVSCGLNTWTTSFVLFLTFSQGKKSCLCIRVLKRDSQRQRTRAIKHLYLQRKRKKPAQVFPHSTCLHFIGLWSKDARDRKIPIDYPLMTTHWTRAVFSPDRGRLLWCCWTISLRIYISHSLCSSELVWSRCVRFTTLSGHTLIGHKSPE